MNFLAGASGSTRVIQQKPSEMAQTITELKSFLLSWPMFVIRTRMEINDEGFWTSLKGIRDEGQLIPGPLQLWRGVVPGVIHHLLFVAIKRGLGYVLRKLFLHKKILSAIQYDLWEQKVQKLNQLTEQKRLRDSQGRSTVEIALSAMRPVVKAATGERETVDVLIDAVSALIAAVVAYPFLTLATFSITGAMGISQIFSMVKMGFQQAMKAKPPKQGGGGGGGGGNKMLKMVGGMLYKGLRYRIIEVVLLYGVKAISHWLLLSVLHRALKVAESFLMQKKKVIEEQEEELEEIGSMPREETGTSELMAIAKKYGGQFVAVLALDMVFRTLIAHPFEVMSARGRVSVPEKQGSLWRAFFFRLITKQMN